MPRLLLVRHGVTEYNSTRRFAGHNDIEMSIEGYRQVEKLRDRLANEKINAVYCSDLKRARATAEVISTGREVEIVRCPELREINYGDAEGLTFKEISQRYPELAQAITDFSLEKIRFPGGESFEEFITRTIKFTDRLNNYLPEQTILIVSHSGPLRVLLCDLLGLDQSHWRQFRLDLASLSVVETYPRGAILSLLNDVSHLTK